MSSKARTELYPSLDSGTRARVLEAEARRAEQKEQQRNARAEIEKNWTFGRDHYAVLGVERTASGEEIKRAAKALFGIFHPDQVSNDATENTGKIFLEINTALETLKDDNKRKRYDESLRDQEEVANKRKEMQEAIAEIQGEIDSYFDEKNPDGCDQRFAAFFKTFRGDLRDYHPALEAEALRFKETVLDTSSYPLDLWRTGFFSRITKIMDTAFLKYLDEQPNQEITDPKIRAWLETRVTSKKNRHSLFSNVILDFRAEIDFPSTISINLLQFRDECISQDFPPKIAIACMKQVRDTLISTREKCLSGDIDNVNVQEFVFKFFEWIDKQGSEGFFATSVQGSAEAFSRWCLKKFETLSQIHGLNAKQKAEYLVELNKALRDVEREYDRREKAFIAWVDGWIGRDDDPKGLFLRTVDEALRLHSNFDSVHASRTKECVDKYLGFRLGKRGELMRVNQLQRVEAVLVRARGEYEKRKEALRRAVFEVKDAEPGEAGFNAWWREWQSVGESHGLFVQAKKNFEKNGSPPHIFFEDVYFAALEVLQRNYKKSNLPEGNMSTYRSGVQSVILKAWQFYEKNRSSGLGFDPRKMQSAEEFNVSMIDEKKVGLLCQAIDGIKSGDRPEDIASRIGIRCHNDIIPYGQMKERINKLVARAGKMFEQQKQQEVEQRELQRLRDEERMSSFTALFEGMLKNIEDAGVVPADLSSKEVAGECKKRVEVAKQSFDAACQQHGITVAQQGNFRERLNVALSQLEIAFADEQKRRSGQEIQEACGKIEQWMQDAMKEVKKRLRNRDQFPKIKTDLTGKFDNLMREHEAVLDSEAIVAYRAVLEARMVETKKAFKKARLQRAKKALQPALGEKKITFPLSWIPEHLRQLFEDILGRGK